MDPTTKEPFKSSKLPSGIQSKRRRSYVCLIGATLDAGAPGYDSTQLVQSLIHAITTKTTPVTGQEKSAAVIEKDPCANVNHLQPMIKVCRAAVERQ